MDINEISLADIKNLLILNLQKLTKIEGDLVEIKATQKYLMTETTFVKFKLQSSQLTAPFNSVARNGQKKLDLPCTTPDAFIDLEHEIVIDEEKKNLLMEKFLEEKSNEYSKFVKCNLRKIIVDSAAINFNWTGAGGSDNIAVKSYEIIELLIDTTLTKLPFADRSACEDTIKSWFRDSKARNNAKIKLVETAKNGTAKTGTEKHEGIEKS